MGHQAAGYRVQNLENTCARPKPAYAVFPPFSQERGDRARRDKGYSACHQSACNCMRVKCMRVGAVRQAGRTPRSPFTHALPPSMCEAHASSTSWTERGRVFKEVGSPHAPPIRRPDAPPKRSALSQVGSSRVKSGVRARLCVAVESRRVKSSQVSVLSRACAARQVRIAQMLRSWPLVAAW